MMGTPVGFFSEPPRVVIAPIPPKDEETWVAYEEFEIRGELNVPVEVLKNHVATGLSYGFHDIVPHPTNDVEVMLVGGGPSLAEHIGTIKRLRQEGVKLITMNNAYRYCIDHGLLPSALVMVDSRDFNARFVDPIIPTCKYFIASQCHPSVFDKVPKEQTYIWHTSAEEIKDLLQDHYKDKQWYHVPGGSTVLLRAIPLFRMLGFKRFHIFGCDSCLEDGKHHAYEQAENDGHPVLSVKVGDKIFQCHPWMLSQAREFIDLIKYMGDEMELQVYGGLLHQILVTGASNADIKEY